MIIKPIIYLLTILVSFNLNATENHLSVLNANYLITIKSAAQCTAECRPSLDSCLASNPEYKWNLCKAEYFNCLASCKRN